jgi:uncharacterized damage-inducible protein DinB
MQTMLLTLIDYHYWANAHVLDCANRLSPRQLAQPVLESHKSLRNILFHMLRTENVWRLLCEVGEVVAPIQNHELVMLPEIWARWREEETALRAYVAQLTDADLTEPRALRDQQGDTIHETRWHMLMHLLFHSAQHRSEAAILLTRYGQSPGDLDFIFYLDDKNSQPVTRNP